MKTITKINENIHRLKIPYKDIFTTLYTVKTEGGILLFDAASFDEDIKNHVLPFLDELKITADMLKYVFVSHNHKDHAGGLGELMKSFPKAHIISRCPKLKEQYKNYNILVPDDGDVILDALKVITICGHTKDSSGIYDMRTKTLISGDSLQLYGIFGSGKWGANISFPKEHIKAIDKLHKMDIKHILTAHDYHPFGYSYVGEETVAKALDACVSPLNEIKEFIIKNPGFSDEQICMLYNALDKPTLGAHVVTAVREMLG